jgi:hypothetical protein
MTFQPLSVQPPRLAFWLVNLFSIPDDVEAIMGDLLEEFSYVACKSGVAFARRWYWRQAVKTIAHLIYTAYRVAPWSTAAAVVGGFLLRWLVTGFLGFPERAIFAVLERYQVPDRHFNTYVFFATTGIDIGYVIVFLFVGCVAALAAKEREMAAAITLSLIFAGMAGVALLTWVASGHTSLLRDLLPWNFADSFAILIGAAIVRSSRSTRRIGSDDGLENPAL